MYFHSWSELEKEESDDWFGNRFVDINNREVTHLALELGVKIQGTALWESENTGYCRLCSTRFFRLCSYHGEGWGCTDRD